MKQWVKLQTAASTRVRESQGAKNLDTQFAEKDEDDEALAEAFVEDAIYFLPRNAPWCTRGMFSAPRD